MNANLAEKLKSLRKEKNISQEKLAQYLNVSFQSVSKWENGNSCPDISLLPAIARYYGITVDELLQVENINEKMLFDEYKMKAWELHRNNMPGKLEIWLDAYKKMPNNIEVKEMLLSTYYDTDKVKYCDEIIDIGVEIYNSDAPNYYKGQAIALIAKIYARNGNFEMAEKWALRSFQISHCQEVIFSQILDNDELIEQVGFFTYWVTKELFYMAMGIIESNKISRGLEYKLNVLKTVLDIYETFYKNDDMSYEDILKLYILHKDIAYMEAGLNSGENMVKKHLSRALECVKKSLHIKEHTLSLPLLDGIFVPAAPEDNKQWVRLMKADLDDPRLDRYRKSKWFSDITVELDNILITNN